MKNLKESDGEDIPSTIPGISVLPLTPPNADPLHTRPVTNWNLFVRFYILDPMQRKPYGRVAISAPAGATPIMVDTPHPL